MNLRQIEAFKAVMEHGTVVRAAEVMHVSQPAVTKLIQAFERAAGFRVFDRVRGRLTPTAEGLTLYREVERVFVAAKEIRSAAEEIRTQRFTNLSVGAMPALSTGFVQRLALLMAYPKRSARTDVVKAFAEIAVREAKSLEQEVLSSIRL